MLKRKRSCSTFKSRSRNDDGIVVSGVEARAIAASKTKNKVKAQERNSKTKDGEKESSGA
jgi:hypothetical protein